jgi:hypothetical protein
LDRSVLTRILPLGAVLFAGLLGFSRCAGAKESGVLVGPCEASAVIPWKGGWLVGDNETSDRLFAYDAKLAPLPDVRLADPVEDIEALAATDTAVWVVGSHSATKKGKDKPLRSRLALLGSPSVLPDLSACAFCAPGLPPEEGGLNIEGAMVLRGALWLGLRGPLVDGKAALLELTGNPQDPSAGRSVVRTVPLDLGGLGVRDLAPKGDGFVVIAGPTGEAKGPFELWWFTAPDAAGQRLDTVLPPNAEGLAIAPDGTALVVTDGAGTPGACKTAATWERVRVP